MPSKKLEYKSLSFSMLSSTVESVDGMEGRVMQGYASTWNLDLGGDTIEFGAFKKCIAERFTASINARGYGRIRFLAEHKTAIGRLLEIKEDSKGLFVKAYFSKTSLGNDTCILVEDHALDQMSIGFLVPPGGSYKDKQGNRHITEIDCQEVSIVTFPMNEETEVEMKSDEAMKLSLSQKNLDLEILTTEEANTLLDHEIKSMIFHLGEIAQEVKKGAKLNSIYRAKLAKVLANVHEVLSDSMTNDATEEEGEDPKLKDEEEKDVYGDAPLRSVFSTGKMNTNQKPVSDPVFKKGMGSSNSDEVNVENVVDPIRMENPANPQTSPNRTASAQMPAKTDAAQAATNDDIEAEDMDSNQEGDCELADLLELAASTLSSFR